MTFAIPDLPHTAAYLSRRLLASGHPEAADRLDCTVRTFWTTWPEAFSEILLDLVAARAEVRPDEYDLLTDLDTTIEEVAGYFASIGHSA